MANTSTMPKGRQTIRKGGSLTGTHGPVSRPIKLWPFEPKPNTTLARLEAAYMSGLDAVDRIEARTRSNAASGRLTPEGVKADALNFAISDLASVLHRARTTIKQAKTEVSERRSKLQIEGPDKTDVAGAFRRMEIRTFLRDMKGDDQTQFFANHGDRLPTEVAQAILEMPPEFSGVPKSRHELLTKTALDTRHGLEIEEIGELEEAIAAAESAVETARDEVRLEAGALDERKFNELVAPIEEKSDAPWLKRRKTSSGYEEIILIDLDKRIERPATQQEIVEGIVAETFDEFNEKKKVA